MILGREPELEWIGAVLLGEHDAAGAVLVVRGEAGIGKTALLDAARAQVPGMRILAACGVETEANLPFAGLAQILAPLADRLDRLPARQAAALAGALALGPPDPGDRLAVCVATLGLLRDAAAAERVAVVVDDAQWLDPASMECLLFAARRLAGSRIALVLAVRDGEDAPRGLEDLPQLRPAPLGDDDARRLVSASDPAIAASVRDAVVAAAAGNPLALREITALLTPDERAGRARLDEPLRPGERFREIFGRRVGALSAGAREALLVAAAAGGGDVGAIRRACEAAAIDAGALEEAEDAGLVRIADGRLAFAHPLVRSAAYHGATAPRLRSVHRALASVLEGDRRAWHLAAAAAGPDEEAAQALQEAGNAAARRRGYVEAAIAHERAARLTEDPDRRARRLLRACNNRVAAGYMEHGQRLLDEAVALSGRLAADPRVLQTRCGLLIGTGQVAAGWEFLKMLADAAVAVADPMTAAHVNADAAMAALITGDCRATHAYAERAAELLRDDGDVRMRAHVFACLAAGRVFRGDAPGARAALALADPLLVHLDPLDWLVALRTQALVMHVASALEDYERSRAEAHAVLEAVDAAGALTARANPLSHAADAAQRLGDWDTAWQEAGEAIALATETGNVEPLVRALAVRARIAAARGRDDEARGLAAEAIGHGERTGIGSVVAHCRAALAFLDLGRGRVEEAVARLEPLRQAIDETHGLVHATVIPWRPDLCEAYVMAGRLPEARREAEALQREADCSGGPAAQALAARCLGLVAEDAFDAAFEAALARDRERPSPFERARTLLAWGSRLHRARRRAEARPVLREAEEIFARLGATPWLERTAAELRAAGAVRRAPRERHPDELTAQEIRVAAVIARGATNQQAATELFLSPKTIDFHLRQIYAKLAIGSRAQLAVIAAERGWLGGAR